MKSIRRILKAHATLAKMFYRRGKGKPVDILLVDGSETKFDLRIDLYALDEEMVIDEGIQEKDIIENLSGMYGERLVQWVTSLSNPEVSRVLSLANDQHLGKITVVYTTNQTNPSKTLIEQACKATEISFESFSVSELIADVSEHVLTPPHRLITDSQERRAVLEGFSIDENTLHLLPAIGMDDPVSRYYAFPENGLIEITRPGSSGPVITYRVVVRSRADVSELSSLSALSSLGPPETVPRDQRRFGKYMSPTEYAMAIAKTALELARTSPPPEYLERKERRIMQVAKNMVDDQKSDVVIVREHINSNKSELWHVGEMVLPNVS